MDILLIAGLWLDGSVWGDVAAEFEARGHHAVPIALPGQGDGNTSATLADQSAAVVAAVDAASGRPMVVGHSAASSLAWIAADARPGKISKVAFIGGFPSRDGAPYFADLPTKDGALPFPGWEEFEGPDSADLDDAAKKAIESAAIPVPEGVIRELCAKCEPPTFTEANGVTYVCEGVVDSEPQRPFKGGVIT